MRHVVVVVAVAIAVNLLVDLTLDPPMLVRWLLAGAAAALAGYLVPPSASAPSRPH